MDYDNFKQKLTVIKKATSITGKNYNSIRVIGNNIEFIRDGKNTYERISINELYQLFTNENHINTKIAKSYISGRVRSPAVAILNEFKPDLNVNNSKNIEFDKQEKPLKGKEVLIVDKIKDEKKFFIVLSELIGEKNLLSKSIEKPITSSNIFLSDNYKDYDFDINLNECYSQILHSLKSSNSFSSNSLSHHIDGLTVGHPIIESRIIEFDEEQHFTPARRETLKTLINYLPDEYFTTFISICSNLDYLNNRVLKKHRIKSKLKEIPASFAEFIDWLEKSEIKSSNYITEKKGFEYKGGRIAQRSYYDCLRDTAHLSKKNRSLKRPLRFAKKTFEEKMSLTFSEISDFKLKELIKEILKEQYRIVL